MLTMTQATQIIQATMSYSIITARTALLSHQSSTVHSKMLNQILDKQPVKPQTLNVPSVHPVTQRQLTNPVRGILANLVSIQINGRTS